MTSRGVSDPPRREPDRRQDGGIRSGFRAAAVSLCRIARVCRIDRVKTYLCAAVKAELR